MREFDRLFVDFFGTPVEYVREPRTWPLALDIADLGNAYQVKAALPGFKPEEVEVTVADGVLDIKAQRKQETESKDGGYLRRELTYGDYERRVLSPIRAQVSSRSRPEARRHALSGAACRAHAARADARFPGSCRAGGRPRPARAGVRRSTRT